MLEQPWQMHWEVTLYLEEHVLIAIKMTSGNFLYSRDLSSLHAVASIYFSHRQFVSFIPSVHIAQYCMAGSRLEGNVRKVSPLYRCILSPGYNDSTSRSAVLLDLVTL